MIKLSTANGLVFGIGDCGLRLDNFVSKFANCSDNSKFELCYSSIVLVLVHMFICQKRCHLPNIILIKFTLTELKIFRIG